MSKMGRPTTAKKDYLVKVRIDENTKEMLEYLEKVKCKSKSQIIRESIALIYGNIIKGKRDNL